MDKLGLSGGNWTEEALKSKTEILPKTQQEDFLRLSKMRKEQPKDFEKLRKDFDKKTKSGEIKLSDYSSVYKSFMHRPIETLDATEDYYKMRLDQKYVDKFNKDREEYLNTLDESLTATEKMQKLGEWEAPYLAGERYKDEFS